MNVFNVEDYCAEVFDLGSSKLIRGFVDDVDETNRDVLAVISISDRSYNELHEALLPHVKPEYRLGVSAQFDGEDMDSSPFNDLMSNWAAQNECLADIPEDFSDVPF
jgi:hypothetical protein